VGEGICFLLNGFSFFAVIVALWAMKIGSKKPEAQRTRVREDLKEGFRYAFGFAPIRSILLFLGLISLAGMPYTILMPIFAKDILHGGPQTLGFLMAATGMGALAGAVYLASRTTVLGLGTVIVIASSLFGAGLLAFSSSHILWLSLLILTLTGFGMMVQMASSNTILQTIVDDDKRGRVMSFYTMAFMGVAPFGSLMAGILAQAIGAPNTLKIAGVACIVGSYLFARKLPLLRGMVRPIYVSKGIILEESPQRIIEN
jgi:MFS family permease